MLKEYEKLSQILIEGLQSGNTEVNVAVLSLLNLLTKAVCTIADEVKNGRSKSGETNGRGSKGTKREGLGDRDPM